MNRFSVALSFVGAMLSLCALSAVSANAAQAATEVKTTTVQSTTESAAGSAKAAAADNAAKNAVKANGEEDLNGNAEAQNLNIPCPSFWSVEPNPSVENSLSYVHDSGKIAVSVTYIAAKTGSQVGAETFSRVAAEQMNCSLPVRSNLLAQAWSFDCENDIQAIVYGEPGNLVLLSISGRNEETENYLESFIKFLSFQAGNR